MCVRERERVGGGGGGDKEREREVIKNEICLWACNNGETVTIGCVKMYSERKLTQTPSWVVMH